ncbi:nucleoprotein [Avalon virus]|uniref:Nucleoprotein n=1 Tax=Avalon virus TaxID=1810950 RepID=A0A191KW73_9VIRU|nr:nucleoprotein [Avalon virus]AMT75379.1 nucleoprotein [Avalon virus]
MASKLDFEDKEGLNKWFSEFRQNFNLSTSCTNSLSLCKELPDLTKYLSMEPKTDREKDAFYSQAVIDAVGNAAPIYECAWTSCTGMVKRGLKWFEDNQQQTTELIAIYDNVKKRVPLLSELNTYQQAARKWRLDVKYAINEFTETASGNVLNTYSVPNDIILDVQTMLKDIIRRRNLVLGASANRSTVQPDHVRYVQSWVMGTTHPASLPPWGETNKKNSSNRSLFATGLCKLSQTVDEDILRKAKKRLEELEKMVEDPDKHGLDKDAAGEHLKGVRASIEEAETMTESSGAMMSQAGNIDLPFSSYFWAYRAGVTPNTFPALSQFLFELGTQARGKEKMCSILNNTPFKWGKGLVGLFADNSFQGNKMYLHPMVLTSGRLSDMAACFGAFPVAYPGRALEGAGHARYILNLKTSGKNACAHAITQLFKIDTSYYPDYESKEVIPSEHMLHQSFIGKKSPFINVSRVKGNAANVQIVSG